MKITKYRETERACNKHNNLCTQILRVKSGKFEEAEANITEEQENLFGIMIGCIYLYIFIQLDYAHTL